MGGISPLSGCDALPLIWCVNPVALLTRVVGASAAFSVSGGRTSGMVRTTLTGMSPSTPFVRDRGSWTNEPMKVVAERQIKGTPPPRSTVEILTK